MQLELQAIARSFAGKPVLQAASCVLPSGASLAITGPSGVGKSTLLQIAAGLEAADAGQVLWDGQLLPRGRLARLRRFRQQIGWLGQQPLLDPQLSLNANCLLPTLFRGRQADDAQRLQHLLAAAGLAGCAGQRAGSLSGGQQVRGALVRALMARPRLLIADEPTGTLDPAHSRQVAQLVLGLAREEGLSVLLATHDRELAADCRQQLRLQEGQLHAA